MKTPQPPKPAGASPLAPAGPRVSPDNELSRWFESASLRTLESAAGALVLQADGHPARGQDPLIRTLGRCKVVGDCWEFQGARSVKGYGRVCVEGKRQEGAHRVVFRAANGDIPEGLYVLHRCDNPPCVNPAHLFLGTKGDNNRDREIKGRTRGLTPGNGFEQRAACVNGHEFDQANTRIDRRHGYRRCRACERARRLLTRERTRERT